MNLLKYLITDVVLLVVVKIMLPCKTKIKKLQLHSDCKGCSPFSTVCMLFIKKRLQSTNDKEQEQFTTEPLL